ncbi:hypothetical protein EJ04DRAFT_558620 [Polyplosphaeria fusca]|uniref:Uncharacterized protein n=1 Tax=Polyplosphaeria fusca TaxID=682080 RepID=A0A9P4R7E8_9PLEO|nr:hypothetical protein EJ04DRAFT_558620 [Polyplosphaeria fusca]
MARVSRSMHAIATPYIYHTLTISDGESQRSSQRAPNLLLRRLQANEGDMAKFVRHLRVEKVPESLNIEEIIENMENLHSLSWNVPNKFPPTLLSSIRSKFPNLRLSVCNHERVSDMDLELLTTFNLQSLDYDIYIDAYAWQSTPNALRHSEFRRITQIVQSAQHLKHLRLNLKLNDRYSTNGTYRRAAMRRFTDQDLTPVRFCLDHTTQLPSLEEFAISKEKTCAGYDFDALHCSVFRNSMDWSQIRKLDLHQLNPANLFAQLVGHTPNLRSLSFGLPDNQKDAAADVIPAARFIETLTNLESLDVTNVKSCIKAIWPAIRKHEKTLRTLILRPTRDNYGSPAAHETAHISSIARRFSRIEHLGYDVPFPSIHERKYRTKASPCDHHLNSIAEMPLKKLDLFLHIPQCESDFSCEYHPDVVGSVPPPELDEAKTHATAIAIAQRLSRGKRLEEIAFWFSRIGREDRFQPYLVLADMVLKRKKDEAWNVESARLDWRIVW